MPSIFNLGENQKHGFGIYYLTHVYQWKAYKVHFQTKVCFGTASKGHSTEK